MVLLALATGVLSFFNYLGQTNYPLPGFIQAISIIAQFALTSVTLAVAVGYRGRRSRPDYDGGQYRVWTLQFGVIMFSLLGNCAVLVVLALYCFGVVTAL